MSVKRKMEVMSKEVLGRVDLRALLTNLFIVKKMKIADAAKLFDCTTQSIRGWMDKYRIEYTAKRFSEDTLKDFGFNGWDAFFRAYPGKTQNEMAGILGCSQMTVHRAYRKWLNNDL